LALVNYSLIGTHEAALNVCPGPANLLKLGFDGLIQEV
jgi:hypothetical protein